MKIYSYNNGSKSAKALAAALGAKLVKHEGKPLNLRDYVINWGCSQLTRELVDARRHFGVAEPSLILNWPDCIAKAVNKLTAFQAMEGAVSIPEFTTNHADASKWIDEGHTVVCRLKLTGHSGEGIVIVGPDEGIANLPLAPLYTKYVKKNAEYRVHVFGDEAFFVQKKARKLEVPDEEVNWQVRNLKGGFIYANQNVEASEAIINQAKLAIAALGLDFGAVDIVVKKDGTPYVLECNTACGLEGTTLDKYVEQFTKFKENNNV